MPADRPAPDQAPETPAATESPSGDDSSTAEFQCSRRAVLGALAGAVVTNTAAEEAEAALDDDSFKVNLGGYTDGQMVMRQYVDGDITEFNLAKDTIMSLDYDGIRDSNLMGSIALRRGDGNFHKFGQATKPVKNGGGTVTFDAADLWGGGAIDLVHGTGAIPDYGTISVDNPTDIDDPIYNDTDFAIRCKIVSSGGTVAEQETVNFTLSVCIPLGFGASFGVNFGRNHPEHWPADWNA